MQRYKDRTFTQVTSKYSIVLYPVNCSIVMAYSVMKPKYVMDMIPEDVNLLIAVEPF